MINMSDAEFITLVTSIVFNVLGIVVCIQATIMMFIAGRLAYSLLRFKPKTEDKQTRPFYTGVWRYIGIGIGVFFCLAIFSFVVNFLLNLHVVAWAIYTISMVLVWRRFRNTSIGIVSEA